MILLCPNLTHLRNVSTILGPKGTLWKNAYIGDIESKIFIDNKLVQFDNTTEPNVIINPLPHHSEGNVNAISTVKERILDLLSPSFPWKAMLQALA